MRASWIARIVPVLFAGLFCVGCDKKSYQPMVINAPAAKKAEAEVRNAPQEMILTLTAEELNNHFKHRQEADWKIRYGQVYKVTAKVKEVRIRVAEEKAPAALRLMLYCPDYAAASIECYFAEEQEEKLRRLGAGQQVTVRGTLAQAHHTVRDHVLDLSGCIFEEQEIAKR